LNIEVFATWPCAFIVLPLGTCAHVLPCMVATELFRGY